MNRYLAIALLLISSSLFAQTYTTPVKVNMGGAGMADRSPMMKLDRDGNVYIAWVRGADGMGNGPIAMSVSTDGGATFSMPVAVCADANCNSNFQRTANFVIDTKSNIHLVWVGNRVNSQPDIWYVRSTDKGKTWTTPVTVCDANDSSKYAQDFPAIACDSNDNLYVSFLDSRETQRKTSSNVHLYFTSSTNGGMTWSTNKKVDILPGNMGGTCECCAEKIACTPEGHVYVVFRSNINDVRDIWLARSYDKGMTFQPSLKISSSDWTISGCPVTGPNLVLDDSEAAHIVWCDARESSGGVSHIYYAYVSPLATFTPGNSAFDINGSQTPNYPNVSLMGKYRAFTYQTSNYGMRYLLASDNQIFVDNRPVNVNGSSKKEFSTVLFGLGGLRYLSWQDNYNDNLGDIYFCKETSPLTSAAVKNQSTENNFTVYPNPVSKENPTFTIAWSSSSIATVRIVDLLGKEVFSSTLEASINNKTISLPSLSKGIYNCIIDYGQQLLMKKIIIE